MEGELHAIIAELRRYHSASAIAETAATLLLVAAEKILELDREDG